MVNTRGTARMRILAVGLGIGAAVAYSPVASADSSSDWLSSIDSLLSGSALPAPSSGLDLAISYDGMSLIQDGNATAITTVGQDGLAIAEGSGAYAYAGGGTGDYALANGTNAFAIAGGDPSDTSGDYDTAIDIGNNDLPSTGSRDGAYSGNGDLGGGSGTGSHNTAIDIGNNTNDAGVGGGNNGAAAGAGALSGGTGDGNYNTAIDIGNNSGYGNGSDAIGGNDNYASEFGNTTGLEEVADAGYGNDNTAISDTSYTVTYGGVYASNGNDNYALNLGPENSFATAFEGNSNVAIVDDPFSSVASYADSGYGFNSDVAEVLGAQGNIAAVTGNDVYDILTAVGHAMGTL